METLQQLLRSLDRANDNLEISSIVYNGITGIIVAIVILAMQYYKYTPSAKYRFARFLYFSASILLLVGLAINRLFDYPPTVTFATFAIITSFIMYSAHTLYVGVIRRQEYKRCGMR